ncbi:MAG TPA: MerC domain-containing protein [Gemmatimonadaceae bacterium]|nr:MerC domain-containing protein [Gemmatimonadaceae bacterium]
MARRLERFADWTGPIGSVFAALCCLGVPWLVAAVTAVGLGFLRKDAILWPLMIAAILLAFWGMWLGYRAHQSAPPLILGVASGISLVAGVIFVHGFPARELIYAGSVGLIVASIANAALRSRCERRDARARHQAPST